MARLFSSAGGSKAVILSAWLKGEETRLLSSGNAGKDNPDNPKSVLPSSKTL